MLPEEVSLTPQSSDSTRPSRHCAPVAPATMARSALPQERFSPPTLLGHSASHSERLFLPQSGHWVSWSARVNQQRSGHSLIHPLSSHRPRYFLATGTEMPGIFTFTEPKWLRLVK